MPLIGLAITVIFGLFAATLTADGQQPDARVARVGLINLGTSSGPSPLGPTALRQALSDLGYIEGQNLIIESRWGENRGAARLRELAYDLAARRVDVISRWAIKRRERRKRRRRPFQSYLSREIRSAQDSP